MFLLFKGYSNKLLQPFVVFETFILPQPWRLDGEVGKSPLCFQPLEVAESDSRSQNWIQGRSLLKRAAMNTRPPAKC